MHPQHLKIRHAIRAAATSHRAKVTFLWAAATTLTVFTAIRTKESKALPPLASVNELRDQGFEPAPADVTLSPVSLTGARDSDVVASPDAQPIWPDDTRWFDGRPVRPVRTIEMVVTAYSPDARSCGPFADGQTATLHSVYTNGFQLVAADPTVLPYGTMLTVGGYAGDQIVPVLDCGGAIKGNRLDLLFPTHEEALEWGVQRIEVVVWAYVDGKPAPDPRKARG